MSSGFVIGRISGLTTHALLYLMFLLCILHSFVWSPSSNNIEANHTQATTRIAQNRTVIELVAAKNRDFVGGAITGHLTTAEVQNLLDFDEFQWLGPNGYSERPPHESVLCAHHVLDQSITSLHFLESLSYQ
eukprot:2745820-Amphidinium_carterae.1